MAYRQSGGNRKMIGRTEVWEEERDVAIEQSEEITTKPRM